MASIKTPDSVKEYHKLWERVCAEGEATTVEVMDFEAIADRAAKGGIEIADADEKGVRWRSHRPGEVRAWQVYKGT